MSAESDRVDAQVCYLLVTPHSAPLAQSAPQAIRNLRDAPYFAPIDIDISPVDITTALVGGLQVTVRRTVYDGLAQVAECSYALPDALCAEGMLTKDRMQTELRQYLLRGQPDPGEMLEEYTALLVATIEGTPDEFVDRNGQALARFIRSQRDVFGLDEIANILISRARYSESEMTVVDWEGAVIISKEADFQSDIELLKVGNYQLLRYRMLDRTIGRNLEAVEQNLHEGARISLVPNRAKSVLRQVIEQRLALMLDFEKINQSLLLIGDWYTAKMYRIVYDEFYLDEWAAAIQNKLKNLESIIQIIQDNFTFSWSRFLELVQIAGWLVLLLGYFVLFFLDARAVK